MTPNWNIGPVARRRLAEIAKVSVEQNILWDGEVFTVEVFFSRGSLAPWKMWAVDTTISKALAGVHKDWKRWKVKQDT